MSEMRRSKGRREGEGGEVSTEGLNKRRGGFEERE